MSGRCRKKAQSDQNRPLSVRDSDSDICGWSFKELEMSIVQANSVILKKLLIFTLVMFGFGFALVPFYEKICEVTGINNLLQADTLAENTQVAQRVG